MRKVRRVSVAGILRVWLGPGSLAARVLFAGRVAHRILRVLGLVVSRKRVAKGRPGRPNLWPGDVVSAFAHMPSNSAKDYGRLTPVRFRHE